MSLVDRMKEQYSVRENSKLKSPFQSWLSSQSGGAGRCINRWYICDLDFVRKFFWEEKPPFNKYRVFLADQKESFGPELMISVSVSHLLITINASSNFAIYCAKVHVVVFFVLRWGQKKWKVWDKKRKGGDKKRKGGDKQRKGGDKKRNGGDKKTKMWRQKTKRWGQKRKVGDKETKNISFIPIKVGSSFAIYASNLWNLSAIIVQQ